MKRMMKKVLSVLTASALALSCMALTGCGSDKDKEEAPPQFQMAICVPELTSAVTDAVKTDLSQNVEALKGQEFTVDAVRTGVESVDPMAYSAAAMKITTMAVSKDLDVVIMDKKNAEENSRAGMFVPLKDVLTEDEMVAFEGRYLSFAEMQDAETPTGNQLEYGIDISDSPLITSNLAKDTYGVFVIRNSEMPEAAHDVLVHLAGSVKQ